MKKNKTIIIAEIGVNHNGNINIAKKLINVAKKSGADYVKFQTFKAENLVRVNTQATQYQSKNLRKKDLIYIQIGGGRWAYGTIIDGTPNDFKVSTGPLKVVKAKSAAFVVPTAILTGGIGIAAKSTGAIIDKKKTDAFMKYIDERIYQNKGNGPELVQNISTESKSEDDIPEKIKKTI